MKLTMFQRKKENARPAFYDQERKVPVLKCSICTGEMVAGFKDKQSGHIEDVMLITGDRDLKKFREEYGIEGGIEKVY